MRQSDKVGQGFNFPNSCRVERVVISQGLNIFRASTPLPPCVLNARADMLLPQKVKRNPYFYKKNDLSKFAIENIGMHIISRRF